MQAPVRLQECVRGLGRLATELCPVRSLVLQPLVLLKIIAYLKSRCKVVLLCLRAHMQSSVLPLKISSACSSSTGVHCVAEHLHRPHLTPHSSQLAGVRHADMWHWYQLKSEGISVGHRCRRARGNCPFPGAAGRAAALPGGRLSRPCPQPCAARSAGVPAGTLAGGADCGSSGPGRGQPLLACTMQSGACAYLN